MNVQDYRRQRRRDSGRLMIAVVFVIAAALFYILSTTFLFNVENISITGSSNYTPQEILTASGIKAGDNLIRTNTEKCSELIESRLVYIENADIRRSFPNTMVINVEPSVPAANFITDTYTLIISSGGKILEKLDESKAGLLNIYGTSPRPELLPGDDFVSEDEHKDMTIDKLMEYFNSADTDKITAVDVTDRAAISYTYDGRIVVELGSVSNLDYKMSFSREIVTTKIGDKTEGVLTILSDANKASFLDKESLENNAKVYSENIKALETGSEEVTGETESTETSETRNDPIME